MGEISTPLFRRNPAIEEAPLQAELMLFNPETSKFYVLNSTMAFAWRQLESATSLQQIAAGVSETFGGVSPDSASADLHSAIDQLVALGLIEPSIDE